MFDKKKVEDIKNGLKKYMPEILDVAVFYAHMKDCIDNAKPYFDTMPETQRERIKKLLEERNEG